MQQGRDELAISAPYSYLGHDLNSARVPRFSVNPRLHYFFEITMIARLVLSVYLACSTSVYAQIQPQEEFYDTKTIFIAIPTQAEPFTSTISKCSTVSPIVIEGVTTGTFRTLVPER